jgi:hypothetical protein
VLGLLKKPTTNDAPRIAEWVRSDDEAAFERIRCPACEWRPGPGARWCCNGEQTPEPPFAWCSTVWNTFASGGCCPGCQHQWQWTSCLRCGEWSRHEDWYS